MVFIECEIWVKQRLRIKKTPFSFRINLIYQKLLSHLQELIYVILNITQVYPLESSKKSMPINVKAILKYRGPSTTSVSHPVRFSGNVRENKVRSLLIVTVHEPDTRVHT